MLPDEKVKERELAFPACRDHGPARSMHKLADLLQCDYVDIGALVSLTLSTPPPARTAIAALRVVVL